MPSRPAPKASILAGRLCCTSGMKRFTIMRGSATTGSTTQKHSFQPSRATSTPPATKPVAAPTPIMALIRPIPTGTIRDGSMSIAIPISNGTALIPMPWTARKTMRERRSQETAAPARPSMYTSIMDRRTRLRPHISPIFPTMGMVTAPARVYPVRTHARSDDEALSSSEMVGRAGTNIVSTKTVSRPMTAIRVMVDRARFSWVLTSGIFLPAFSLTVISMNSDEARKNHRYLLKTNGSRPIQLEFWMVKRRCDHDP